jgi:hypothetical protein
MRRYFDVDALPAAWQPYELAGNHMQRHGVFRRSNWLAPFNQSLHTHVMRHSRSPSLAVGAAIERCCCGSGSAGLWQEETLRLHSRLQLQQVQ